MEKNETEDEKIRRYAEAIVFFIENPQAIEHDWYLKTFVGVIKEKMIALEKSDNMNQKTTQTQAALTDWARRESERLESAHQQAWDERDYKPFLKLEVGETFLQFADRPPRANPKMPGKLIFRVNYDGHEYDLAVRERSPLYHELAKTLAKGERIFTIVRTGTGKKDTKYSLKFE